MSIPLSILGRCWREKMISVLSFGHPKSHFSALANGYFFSSKMAHFSYQKMVLRSAETKNRGHFFMPTSPQNSGIDMCVYHFWFSLSTDTKLKVPFCSKRCAR